MQIIVFTLKDLYYAISTEKVEEISKCIKTTFVPNGPSWVEGLINLRGNVVSLINLGKFLNYDYEIYCEEIIIVENEEEKIGIMVTNIEEVVEINEKDIQKINKKTEDGIIGIIKLGEKIVNLMDINSLFSKNEG